jgi:hypothetical protein
MVPYYNWDRKNSEICQTLHLFLLSVSLTSFLARLYEVYGELSYSPWRWRPDFRLNFMCSKIFFTITFFLFLQLSTSNFKYMFLIIYHILWDKIHNSSTNIFRLISRWTYYFLLLQESTRYFKYMILIINHILWYKVHKP